MPVKVSQGVFGGDVNVPSWEEFLDHLNVFRKEKDNKEALWRAVNELKRNPAADIYSEFRALRDAAYSAVDAAFSAVRDIHGPLPNNGWHIWKCIEVAGKRLDALEQRLKELPDKLCKTVRESVRAELETLFKSVKTNLDSILKDNGELKGKTSSLSHEVERCRVRVESAEKQFQAVPEKIAELQRLIDDAQADLNCAKDENNHLKEEVDALRKELATCRRDVDALLHPPKREWFSGIRTRCSGFFRKIFLEASSIFSSNVIQREETSHGDRLQTVHSP